MCKPNNWMCRMFWQYSLISAQSVQASLIVMTCKFLSSEFGTWNVVKQMIFCNLCALKSVQLAEREEKKQSILFGKVLVMHCKWYVISIGSTGNEIRSEEYRLACTTAGWWNQFLTAANKWWIWKCVWASDWLSTRCSLDQLVLELRSEKRGAYEKLDHKASRIIVTAIRLITLG